MKGKAFSRFNRLMAMAAAMMQAAFGQGMGLAEAVTKLGGYKSRGHGMAPGRWGRTGGGRKVGNSRGRAYPEQSARQAMRRFRRAQGGPGLYEGIGAMVKGPNPKGWNHV